MAQRELQIIANLEDNVSEQLDGIQGNLNDMKPTFKKMAGIGTAGFAAIVGGSLKAATEAGEYADRITDAADATGMSTEAIQEWEHVAEAAGVQQEVVTDSVQRFARQLDQAADESTDMGQTMEKLGVEVQDADGNFRDMDSIMEETIAGLQGMENDTERVAEAMDIFGRGAGELAPILGMTEEEVEGFKEEAHEMGLVMDDEAAEKADKFRERFEILQRQLGGMVREVGQSVIPIFQDLVERISPIITQVTQWINENPRLTATILAVTAAGFGIIGVLGTLGLLVASITPAIGALAAVFAVVASPVGIVIGLIAGLIAGLVYLWNTNEEFKEFVINAWEIIKDYAEVIFNEIRQLVEAAMERIQQVVKLVLEKVREFWDRNGERIISILESVWSIIQSIIQIGMDFILGLIRTVTAIIEGDWSTAWEEIKNTFSKIWDSITDIFSDVLSIMMDLVSIYITEAREAIGGWLEWTWESIKQTWEGIYNFFGDIWDGITNIFKNAINGVIYMVEGMINRIISGLNSFANRANRIGDRVAGVPGVPRPPRVPTISEISLPRLHDGGIIDLPASQEMPIMARGQEAVVPLDKGGFGTTVNITVRGDVSGRDLVDKVKKAILKETNREIRV